MADSALSEMMSRMSPDNRSWVKELSAQERRGLLKIWQDEGGATGLGAVGSATNDVSADAVVEKWRRAH